MSTLKTNNIEHLDGSSPSIQIGVGGGVNISGVVTATSFDGDVTGNINSSGISTLSNVVVGGATTELVVTGDARITGILTVGTASVTLNGTDGTITGINTINGLTYPTAGALSNRNMFINGAMQVAQRGTSSSGETAGGYKTVDRFQTVISTAGTWTISQSTDAPAGFSNSIKYDCTTADTSLDSTSELWITQKIEAQNLQHLNYGTADAQDCTFSFYFKTNKTGVYTVEIFQADATRTIGFEMNVTQTGWERYEFIVPGDTAGTINNDNGIGLWCFIWMASGTGKTSGTFTNGSWAASTTTNRLSSSQVNFADSTSNELYVTGYQFELGRKATPFEHRSYGDELERCRRYYQKFEAEDAYTNFGIGVAYNADQLRVNFPLRPEMRDKPSALEVSAGTDFILEKQVGATAVSSTAIMSTNVSKNYGIVVFNSDTDFDLGGAGYHVYSNNESSAYIAFYSEL